MTVENAIPASLEAVRMVSRVAVRVAIGGNTHGRAGGTLYVDFALWDELRPALAGLTQITLGDLTLDFELIESIGQSDKAHGYEESA